MGACVWRCVRRGVVCVCAAQGYVQRGARAVRVRRCVRGRVRGAPKTESRWRAKVRCSRRPAHKQTNNDATVQRTTRTPCNLHRKRTRKRGTIALQHTAYAKTLCCCTILPPGVYIVPACPGQQRQRAALRCNALHDVATQRSTLPTAINELWLRCATACTEARSVDRCSSIRSFSTLRCNRQRSRSYR